MRRHDREITDSREILSIVNECKVIRLAMLDEQGLPYIIPLNFVSGAVGGDGGGGGGGGGGGRRGERGGREEWVGEGRAGG